MMKLPEEEADQELAKRLQQKFEGFNAPVKDRVREGIFAALSESSKMTYWLIGAGAILFLTALVIGYIVYDHKNNDQVVFKGEKAPPRKINRTYSSANGISRSSLEKRKDSLTIRIEKNKKAHRQTTGKEMSLSIQTVSKRQKVIHKQNAVFNGKSENYHFKKIENADIKINENNSTHFTADQFVRLTALSSNDSFKVNTSFTKPAIPHYSPDTSSEMVKKPGILNGVKGVFSASVMQTFALIDLSQSTSDHIQNFRFAPLLSSRSLSYKIMAGVEKKHTRLSLSYAYLRNWNEYEIGTNQVVATKIGERQYTVLRVGEKHVEDSRSHLLGIVLQQKFLMPQHMLKGYSVNIGAEYTLVMPSGQNLVWGNLGFYKQVYQSSVLQFEVGPYAQYSFIQREIAGQTWKSRPYQAGVSFQIKMK